MTPQERDVIAGIFDRLKQAANQPRDPEAERFIADRLRDQPYAPYAMAQSVFVQEQALTNLQAQVEELQGQLRDLQNRQTAEPPAQAGGFLSGIFGGAPKPTDAPQRSSSVPIFPQRAGGQPSSAWNTQQAAPMQQPGMAQPGMGQPGMGQPGMGQQPPGPWGGQAAAAQQPSRGGGFMASALTTAAGVAGGMMLGNVLTNAFGGHKAGAEAKPAETAAASPLADSVPADNTGAAGSSGGSAGYNDGSSDPANYQNAGHDAPADEGYDDGSSFADGGGDDDSWA